MAIQDMAGDYGLLPDYVQMPMFGDQSSQMQPPSGGMPLLAAAQIPQTPQFPRPAPAPQAAPAVQTPAAVPPLNPQISPSTGKIDLASLLEKYSGTGESSYAGEIATARKSAADATAQFNDMLARAIDAQGEDTGPSKAEMYFRLAAAFGRPTKTGSFIESLGEAGSEMSKAQAEERQARNTGRMAKLQLMLEGQKAKMAAAKEDVTALRGLAAEEMKDRRAIATKMIEEYIASGKPQSEAGKQAKDLGLKPGTAAYESKVNDLIQTSVNAQMARINVQMEGLGLRKKEAEKLSPTELKLKDETSESINSGEQALKDLSEAYRLNPNTFDSSLVDTAQRKLLEAVGSKDPKVVATRYQANLLSKQAIGKLRAAFGGNPTEGERAALLALEGIDAKSKEERAAIIKNTYTTLKARVERDKKKLQDISSGMYRQAAPVVTPGGLE